MPKSPGWNVTLRVESGEGAGAGEASSLRPGRLIWTVGLGSLKNGSAAGVVALRQTNLNAFTAATFQTGSLVYSTSSAEVVHYYGTGSSANTYQIFANQCLAEIAPASGGAEGFTIKFYARSDISTTLTNNLWQPISGREPFVEYLVENTTPFAYTNSAKLRITKTARLNSAGQTATNTWRTELRQVGGQPAGQVQWDVVDWTTNALVAGSLPKGPSWSRWTYSNSGLNERVQVYDGSDVLASDTYNTFANYAWGTELVSKVEGYGGSNSLVTSYAYNTNSNAWGGYTRLLYAIEPSGKWIRYAYYDDIARLGMIKTTYEPWGSGPSGPTAADYATGLVTEYEYAFDLTGFRRTRPNSVVRKVNTAVIGQTTSTYADTTVTESVTYSGTAYSVSRPLVEATTKSYYSSTGFLTTISRAYREDAGMALLPNGQYEITRGYLPGQPYDATAADGTKQVWTYARGVRDSTFWSFVPLAEGTEWLVRSELLGPSGVVDGGSTFETSVHAFDGTLVLQHSGIRAESAWRSTGGRRWEFLKGIVPYRTSLSSGTHPSNWWYSETNTWAGGLLIANTDPSGVARTFQYNSAGWRTTEVKAPKAGQPANLPANSIHTIHAYDGAGRVTSVRTQASATTSIEDLLVSTSYDKAGRITATVENGPNGNLTTSYAYFFGGNPRSTRITLPNSGTRILTNHLDGRVHTESGTAVYGGVNSDTVTYGHDSGGNTWSKRTPPHGGYVYEITDWLGRPIRTTTPGYNSARIATVFDYHTTGNGIGRVKRQRTVQANSSDVADFDSTPMGPPTLFAYDVLGRLVQECLDVDENGTVDTAGPDRITTNVYSAFAATEAVSGLIGNISSLETVWSKLERKVYVDSSSTLRTQSTTLQQLNAYATGGTTTPTIHTKTKLANAHYTGSNEPSTAVITTTRHSPATATTQTSTTRPGATNTGTTTSVNGWLSSAVSIEGVPTTHHYDSYGRRWKTQGREDVLESYTYYPGTTAVKNVRNAYMEPGVIGTEWQTHHYDSAGRMVLHEVYKKVGSVAATRYEYDLRGNLLRTWGNGAKPVEYVYNDFNRRTSMKLFRDAGNAVNWNAATWPGAAATADTTTWNYDATTGLVTSKVYPANGGSSATVSFTFTGFNQPGTRTWARGTQTQYAYYDASTPSDGARGELKQVSYPNSGTTGQNVATDPVGYKYNRLGRLASVTEKLGGVTVDRTFTYRTTSDLQLETQTFPSYFGSDNKKLTYTYATSGAIGRSTGFQVGAGSTAASIQSNAYEYQAATGRLENITSLESLRSVSRVFTYGYHPSSNRIVTVASGNFQRTNYWQDWRNLLDGVTTTWNGANRANFIYDYDWVGARTGERHTDPLSSALGQSAGIDTTHQFSLREEVLKTEAKRISDGISIDNRYRRWDYDNAGNRELEYRVGSPNIDYVVNALNQYGSRATVVREYDADGNLTSDGPSSTSGTWTFKWDAENRLHSATKRDGTKHLDFTYDYAGRRVGKIVRNGGPGAAIASESRYLYEGWNIVSEISVSGGTTFMVARNFLWGLDISASLGGAGGVGALLQIADSATIRLPVYDANGNVRGLLDATSGDLVAAYAYSTFGEILQSVNVGGGTAADANPIRFASKWYDGESGLYDYNRRVYSPQEGRFLSRDPIHEHGGLNLYAYCGNDPVGRWDFLGMDPPDINSMRDHYSRTEPWRQQWLNMTMQTTMSMGSREPLDPYVSSKIRAAGSTRWGTTGIGQLVDVAHELGLEVTMMLSQGQVVGIAFSNRSNTSVLRFFVDARSGTWMTPIGGFSLAVGSNSTGGPPPVGFFSSATAANSGDLAAVTGKASQFGTGTLLKPGMVPALDAMLTNDNVVNQLGVLYGLNKNYGIQKSGGNVDVTEFFATINGGSATSNTLYGNTITLSSATYNAGGWTASVTPRFTMVDLQAVAHTHPINGVPSDGHDFAFQSPILSSRGVWSIVVTPSNIYFTGPQQGQYYYLPTSDFINAGKATNRTVTIPAQPPSGP
ncbi:hypothetical protein ASA1KI_37600 [Opitutales bacterium ASA1]|uniref:RHS repeat-associated core domain-containing protein n=1 Tax=Congregicoccus parvus TaxID=3081749 RepID=UPI002B28B817|nr:hypothetical protein ASA1KI_37600 [Opitutales bacterium ASA1]